MSTYYNLPKPKSGIQQMIDEAYNKWNYSKAFVYWLNDKEQSYDGRDGLKNASSDFLGSGGEALTYLGPYGRFVGTVFQVADIAVQTGYDVDKNGFNSTTGMNIVIRSASTVAPSVISNKLPVSSKTKGILDAVLGSSASRVGNNFIK